MFKWLTKDRRANGLVAVCPSERGVAAAKVGRGVGDQPQLTWVDFIAADKRAGGRAGALAALVHDRRLAETPVTSLMPIGQYSLILVEAPNVPTAELRAAVRWRVKDLIDYNVDEAVVDVFRVPTLKGGQDNMLYAVVARAPAVRTLALELTNAGIALEFIDIPEFAIRNLTALMPEDVGGVAFIHIEEQVGLITITRQRTLYLSRRFDYGRSRLLATGTHAITAETEGLLDAIVIEVQRSLDYYESHFAQPPVRGIVMAPLGLEMVGLEDYLGSQLGIPTRTLELGELIEMEGEVAPDIEFECIAAIGAALRFGEASL